MNKLFVVLLAVCLVSTLVEAEDAKPNGFETIQKELDQLGKQISDKLSESINPDQIKKTFNEAVDKVNKAISDMKAKSEAGKQ